MFERIKRVSVATTAVVDDENDNGVSKSSSVEQQAVSSHFVICKNSSISAVEISPCFFRKSMSRKTT